MQEALELRTYLHDRSLMEYADNLETLGKPLSKLLEISPSLLTSPIWHEKRSRGTLCRSSICLRESLHPPCCQAIRGRELLHQDTQLMQISHPLNPPAALLSATAPVRLLKPIAQLGLVKTKERANKLSTQKGIVAAAPAMPRLCGILKPFEIVDNVTPLSVLEKIPIQKLTPEYRKGVDPWALGGMKVPPPSRAGELWAKRPTLILCVRRPGCVMCRAEAHQLYARKAMFDAMDIQLVAVFNEYIDSEVRSFWPRYWGGAVAVDKNREFFCALGGGKLLKDNIVTGFFFNPRAIANYKRARATGIENNRHGEGTVKGGLYIMRPGNGGVAYQFIERNFGDWAPLEEVLDVCSNLQKNSPATPVTHEDFSFDP
ncbi:hypothetical protein O6H91_12G001400 [Diphasiastrum complanatum]|uniref:Uncharacterized protein n=1 Tax=Diphasiastrum complanatum TaxID=34168 RepID=A0ACC2BY89_DIPCM|nr:hypothetical protein O6H91_12G001400 [Diphasiastrum complanatum]